MPMHRVAEREYAGHSLRECGNARGVVGGGGLNEEGRGAKVCEYGHGSLELRRYSTMSVEANGSGS